MLKPKRVAQKAFIHVGLCVSSRNKCVIGLRDHSWKDPWSGAETGPEGNYNQSAPATHTGREDGENEETGWRQLWVPVLRRTVFISIIRPPKNRGVVKKKKKKTCLTQKAIVILALTGDEPPRGAQNRQSCQNPYLICVDCQDCFPKLPSRRAEPHFLHQDHAGNTCVVLRDDTMRARSSCTVFTVAVFINRLVYCRVRQGDWCGAPVCRARAAGAS